MNDIFYADIDRDLKKHPISNDTVRVTNENSVKQAIVNLVLTDRGEWPWEFDKGCDVRALLFESFDNSTIETVKKLITETLNRYEPRADILDVNVTGNIDRHEINISITFMTINTTTPETVEVIFKRDR